VLDRCLIEEVARDLLTSPGLVEKDWHVTHVIAVLVRLDHSGAGPAVHGGSPFRGFSKDIKFNGKCLLIGRVDAVFWRR
jgi:hypothetical protein